MATTDLKHLARFLLVPAALTLVVVVLFMHPPHAATYAEDGGEVVRLARKDTFLHRVMATFGGPSGTMWYTPAGPRLGLRLRATRLTPARRYILELDVDSTIYDIASYEADADGRITADTALTEFAEGVCVGPNYHAPRPLQGTHTIRSGSSAMATRHPVRSRPPPAPHPRPSPATAMATGSMTTCCWRKRRPGISTAVSSLVGKRRAARACVTPGPHPRVTFPTPRFHPRHPVPGSHRSFPDRPGTSPRPAAPAPDPR